MNYSQSMSPWLDAMPARTRTSRRRTRKSAQSERSMRFREELRQLNADRLAAEAHFRQKFSPVQARRMALLSYPRLGF